MTKPLISIGLPVYNGGEQLREAIDSLLAQTESDFELIISDNCSTDEITQQITEEYARRDPRVRLTRQTINLGAHRNFLWALQQARGDYFMWAAHDDRWSPNYVEVLSRRLNDAPDAVLATGLTEVESIDEKGRVSHATTLPAPNADRWKTTDLFIEEFACVWVYGMYRTRWLQDHAPQLLNYPMLYGDVIWLFDLTLTEQVVGDRAAVFYYFQTRGKYKELKYRRKIELWAIVAYHVVLCQPARLPAGERLIGLKKACWLVYKHHISRGNVIGTTVRVVKLAVIWTYIGLETLVRRSAKWIAQPKPAPIPSDQVTSETSAPQPSQQQPRRAA